MNQVPVTVADMLPPKKSSLITEAASFLRSHWDEIRPFYQSINGETKSMHGSIVLDEAACVFEIQKIAKKNGFAFLGKIPTNKLRKAMRFGFKRNTGMTTRMLVDHYKQRLISDQENQKDQED